MTADDSEAEGEREKVLFCILSPAPENSLRHAQSQ